MSRFYSDESRYNECPWCGGDLGTSVKGCDDWYGREDDVIERECPHCEKPVQALVGISFYFHVIKGEEE